MYAMFTPRLGLVLTTEKYRVPHSTHSASQQPRSPSSISFVHLFACLLACFLPGLLMYTFIQPVGRSVDQSSQSVLLINHSFFPVLEMFFIYP